MMFSDVYMDHINRKSSIDMLVSFGYLFCDYITDCLLQMLAARRSIGRQFILITPGSRSDISLAPDVRVKEYVPFFLLNSTNAYYYDYRLAEPERGQSTLTFRAS